MATDKLVDFDHVTDYISREDAVQCAVDIAADLFNDGSYGIAAGASTVGIWLKNLPAADVRPVAEISDAVYEAMYFLNSVSAQMPYHVYSALFDLILGILPTCGADMREPNLDTTKGKA